MLLLNNEHFKDTVVKLSPEETYKEYTPIQVTEPVEPRNYSNFKVLQVNYTINVTATAEEDVNITNKVDRSITVGDVNLDSNNSITITENTPIEPLSIYAPIQLTEPVEAENYSKVNILALNNDIDITATVEEDTKVSNKTGSDIKVGATTVANNEDIIIVEDTIITL